ncbi:methyl-accepting chemotaxis protein [Shewanella psychrotolerans]|uniref:methyl-accepting chemotaxis protein n=1 Tax=Shewanella psychrotolerans TaxID=2864206 RepID=UPI001C6591A7|nr:methyl-accepting chemotaxis protein [Shewanella psychrotolerans]QYK00945.1 methyl-accepting chemotaxis protein [Shewanella psychrotolerans]
MFKSIRVKFSLMFIAVAAVLIFISIFDATRNHQIVNQLQEFSQRFNPATSAILNADRDLYQAQLSEVTLLNDQLNAEQRQKEIKNWQENVDQAKDRMLQFREMLANHPTVTDATKGFDEQFNLWYQASGKVVKAVEQQDYTNALVLHNQLSKKEFKALRSIYNAAGEAADQRVKELDTLISERAISQNRMSVGIAAIVAIFALIIAYFGPKTIVDAINDITNRINDIANGDGNLTQRIQIKRDDEISTLASSFNLFVEQLQKMIITISAQTHEVNSSVEQLSEKSTETLTISSDQSQFVETIVTAVNEMSAAVKEVASNAMDTASEINKVNDQTIEGKRVLSLSVEQIDQLSGSVKQAVTVIEKLSENSANIASVLDVIRGIAEQTNLLALNAAIEAARAGEQGRGFAVVADEVRTLASRTETSTQDIQKMIEQLQHGVLDAVKTIEAGAALTSSTVSLTAQTQNALDEILSSTSRVSDMSSQTATATEEQTHVSEEINRNLTELSDKTVHFHDVISETQKIVQSTQTICNNLQHEVSRFKVA